MRDEPQHWARVKEVLKLALDASPAEQSRVVREACEGNLAVEREAESLLAVKNRTGKLDDCLHEIVSGLLLTTEVPRRIGPYRIEWVLGRGGNGNGPSRSSR